MPPARSRHPSGHEAQRLVTGHKSGYTNAGSSGRQAVVIAKGVFAVVV